MSRGVAQGEVFYADEDYRKFLEYLEKTSERFQLEIFAFVLMGNHYHLFYAHERQIFPGQCSGCKQLIASISTGNIEGAAIFFREDTKVFW